MEILKTILLAIIGGGAGAALINAWHDTWKWKAERKAKKEDMAEASKDKVAELTKQVKDLNEKMAESDKQMEAMRGAMRCILLDRIIHLGQSFIREGEVDFDDRKRLRDMHDSYHYGLGGNGDADKLMQAVDALPLKNH